MKIYGGYVLSSCKIHGLLFRDSQGFSRIFSGKHFNTVKSYSFMDHNKNMEKIVNITLIFEQLLVGFYNPFSLLNSKLHTSSLLMRHSMNLGLECAKPSRTKEVTKWKKIQALLWFVSRPKHPSKLNATSHAIFPSHI